MAVISVEKVIRACVSLKAFVTNGLNITAARTPAGSCFKHPSFSGAQSCACTERDACNDSPFIGMSVNGQFLPSKDKPDDTGKLPADTGTTTTKAPADGAVGNANVISDPAASGNANIDTSAADDKNKKSAADGGNSTSGNQGSTAGSHCLHGSFASCIVLLHLAAYNPVVKLITFY